MPRSLEFDPQETLQKAMMLFWEKGHENTSIHNLVKHTKVQRSGLYSAFGGKKKLFLKSLELYVQQVMGKNTEMLRSPDANIKEIRRFFEQFVDFLTLPEATLGCLMCLTAGESVKPDKSVSKVVGHTIAQLENMFLKAIQRSKHKGLISKKHNEVELAHFFIGGIFAVASLSRAPVSMTIPQDYVRSILKFIDNLT